jgi:hypothetical protein
VYSVWELVQQILVAYIHCEKRAQSLARAATASSPADAS